MNTNTSAVQTPSKITGTATVRFDPGSICPINGTTIPEDKTERPLVDHRYKLVRVIGGGAQATVWLATDLNCRPVVVKRLREELLDNTTSVERAIFERECLARLSHPNVVASRGGGVCRNHGPYSVMEYVEGENLLTRFREHHARGEPMRVQEAVEIALAVAAGVQHSHSRGILHLDIKGGNILLPNGKSPKAKICDYGISLPIRSKNRQRASRTLVGTPAYASPEQLLCRPDLDPRSDLYSLGVVTFMMLAGSNPFAGTDAEENPTKRCAPPVSLFRANVPKALCELIQKLLNNDREKRPRTAAEVAAQLRRVLAMFPPRSPAKYTSPPSGA